MTNRSPFAFASNAAVSISEPPSSSVTLRPTSRGKLIGREPRMRRVLETIDRVAKSSCTVLVTGESGTGKELVVAALHDASTRREGPLVTINCGAIPSDLVESELFGHTRGAFTGAQAQRRGHVAAAENGTLFLDEVGELPLSAQVKLLRLLQQREYTPLGESKSVKCDVRIVAATNRDLAAEVTAGRFREDLYYRLNVIHIKLPALRERGADVLLLAEHFFRVCADRCGRSDLIGLSPEAAAAVTANRWAGNVRALENAVERAVLLARGPHVEIEDLFEEAGRRNSSFVPTGVTSKRPSQPPASQTIPTFVIPESGYPRALPEQGISFFTAVESYQSTLIRQALARTDGNKNQAARLLGLNRTTLVEMIRRRNLAKAK